MPRKYYGAGIDSVFGSRAIADRAQARHAHEVPVAARLWVMTYFEVLRATCSSVNEQEVTEADTLELIVPGTLT
jgi:hypothetical protein